MVEKRSREDVPFKASRENTKMKRKNLCQICALNFCQRFCSLKEIAIAIGTYFIVISIYLVTFPFYIYRKTVTYLAKLKDPDITTCITGLSATFLRDYDSYHFKSRHTSVACLRMKGEAVEASRLQEIFLDRVVLKKKEDEPDKLAYPELQQHYTRFMGYSFFKWDRRFHIKNHVTSLQEPGGQNLIITKQSLVEIWENLMSKPYDQYRSPWEAVIVPNYVPDPDEDNPADWFIFFRLHHGLADGFWFEKILSCLFATTFKPNFVTKLVSSVTPSQKLLMNLRCLVLGPYDLANKYLRFRDDFHALHYPHYQLAKRYFLVEGPHIQVNDIKKLKNHYHVAFTTILLEIICGGMRRYMMKKGMQLPKRYSVGMPFPKPKQRGDKMGNDFYLSIINLPINLPGMHDRILKIHKGLKQLCCSSYMQMMDLIIKQLTNLPGPILREVTRKSLFSAAYSTLPGPEGYEDADYFGRCEIFDANFSHGMATDSLGLAFSTFTFAGKMRMTVFADRNLVDSRKKTGEIVACFMEEYSNLKESVEGHSLDAD